MAIFSSVIAPMAIGFLADKMMGGKGLKGAVAGFGFGGGAEAAAGGKGMVGNTAANSLNAGTALGSGGMNTFQGMNTLGMNSAVNAGLGVGQIGNVVTPENTSNLLMDSAYNAQIAPSDVYTGDLSMMENQKLGLDMSGMNSIGIDTPIGLNSTNPLPVTGGGYDSTLGAEQLNYQPDFTPITGAEQGTGGYEQSGMFDNGLLNYLGDFVPTKKDLGGLALNMGVNALTPEQEERIRHQQAMVSRGQTGSLLGQGGYQGIGGPYISRAGS